MGLPLRRSSNVLLAWLVTGVLLEAGVLLGLAVNLELLVSCSLLSVAYLWFRQVASGHSLRSGAMPPSIPWKVAVISAATTLLLLLTAPARIVRFLAAGPDNGAWLFVASQFADQRPVWSGHGGPMTVALALATGVGRLFAVFVRASSSSVIVPIGAVSFLTALSLVAALMLSRRSARGLASDLAVRVALVCGAVLLLDFGHLSAWFVLLLTVTCIVGYRSADPQEQIALLWVAVLSLLLWLPVKPLAGLGALGVLVLMVRTRRTRGLSRGLLIIDAVAIIPALLISLRSLTSYITSNGGLATGLVSISVGELLRGAAEFLDRSGGTHSFPLLISLAVFVVVALFIRRSRPDAPELIGLTLIVWALALRAVDEVANGGSGYGSQKLLLLATLVTLVLIAVSEARTPKLTYVASVMVVLASTMSVVNFHATPDQSSADWRGESWEGVATDGLRGELSALPKACLTDVTWDRFDDPIADDLSVRSAYTCTRFLGSLAARDDLPNELLEFNVGHESWGWVASRVSESSFLRDEVLVLNSSRVPYRRTRLIDFVAESASVPEMSVLTMSQTPDAVSEDAPPHSIDVVDRQSGIVSGWASRSISALVVVSEELGESPLASTRRLPRPDVERVLGPRELAVGFRVKVGLPEAEAVCFLVMDVDGRLFRAMAPFGC